MSALTQTIFSKHSAIKEKSLTNPENKEPPPQQSLKQLRSKKTFKPIEESLEDSHEECSIRLYGMEKKG